MNRDLTFAEQLLLARLLDGPRDDHNTVECRVLINNGFAQRVGTGMMEITAAGVDELGKMAHARGEADDIFNGDHGF